jgi:hypothetical protein
VSYASLDRNYRVWARFDTPTLSIAAENPDYFCAVNNPNHGHAGMWPDVNDTASTGRYDDLVFQIRGGAAYASGLAVLFNTEGAAPAPIPAPGLGTFCLDPTDRFFSLLIMGAVTLDPSGIGQHNLPLGPRAAQNQVRAAVAGFGCWHSQALLINSSFNTFALTTMDTAVFADPTSTSWSADSLNPAVIPGPFPGKTSIYVCNEGKGSVNVVLIPSNTSFTIKERTAQRIASPFIQASTSIEIRTLVDISPPNGAQYKVRGSYRL